jgi:hypothetical protein
MGQIPAEFSTRYSSACAALKRKLVVASEATSPLFSNYYNTERSRADVTHELFITRPYNQSKGTDIIRFRIQSVFFTYRLFFELYSIVYY